MSDRRRIAVAAAVALALGLAACSPSPMEVQSGDAVPQSGPNLDEARIDQIISQISDDLAAADKTKKADGLTDRLTDPALTMRSKQYVTAERSQEAVPTLTLTPQEGALSVTNSTDWPRVVLDIAQADAGSLPTIAIITQADPRSDYKLENWGSMLGGTQISTAAVKVGTPYLPADSPGYQMSPRDTVKAYIDMLNKGATGDDHFAADEFASSYKSDAEALNESVKDAGTVKAEASTARYPVTAVQLADGEALVSSAFTYTHTYARTVKDSSMKLGGTPAAVNQGNDAVVGTVTVKFTVSAIFTVPLEGSDDKAKLIGVDRVISGITRDDNAKPAGE